MVSGTGRSGGALPVGELVQINPCFMLFYTRPNSGNKLGLNLVLSVTKLSQFLTSWSDFYWHHGERAFFPS